MLCAKVRVCCLTQGCERRRVARWMHCCQNHFRFLSAAAAQTFRPSFVLVNAKLASDLCVARCSAVSIEIQGICVCLMNAELALLVCDAHLCMWMNAGLALDVCAVRCSAVSETSFVLLFVLFVAAL